jgi:hypothetical protein
MRCEVVCVWGPRLRVNGREESENLRRDTSRLESFSDKYLIKQMASGGYIVYAQRLPE